MTNNNDRIVDGAYFMEFEKADEDLIKVLDLSEKAVGTPSENYVLVSNLIGSLSMTTGELARIADELHEVNENLKELKPKPMRWPYDYISTTGSKEETQV